MKDREKRHGGYVRQVQEGTQRYAHRLLAENEKLRAEVAQLEAERLKLADAARLFDGALSDNATLRAENGSLRSEREFLAEQLTQLRGQADRHQSRQLELESHLEEIEEANRRFSDEYLKVEEQNANLANLYVASYRLHGTVERKEVVLAIQEIVANLVGSEELAIFEREADGAALSLVAAFGVDPAPLREIAFGLGIIGRTAETGDTYVRAEGGDRDGKSAESRVTACIPLTLDGRVTGVIAIFRLLSHKAALEPADHELFDLLASQAAVALYCTRLHVQYGRATASTTP